MLKELPAAREGVAEEEEEDVKGAAEEEVKAAMAEAAEAAVKRGKDGKKGRRQKRDEGATAAPPAPPAAAPAPPPPPPPPPPAAPEESGGGRPMAREGVLCVGLSCVDMQLLGASKPSSDEAIAKFEGHATAPGQRPPPQSRPTSPNLARSRPISAASRCSLSPPGGSTSNTASALRALGVGAAVLTCVGKDAHGAELERAYEQQALATPAMPLAPPVTSRATSALNSPPPRLTRTRARARTRASTRG